MDVSPTRARIHHDSVVLHGASEALSSSFVVCQHIDPPESETRMNEVVSPWHAIGTAAELFSWFGFSLGAVFLFCWLIARVTSGTWHETDAVRVEDGRIARWIVDDGSLHERTLTPEERRMLGRSESFRVFYNSKHPERMRLERTGHGVRVFRLLTLILIGVGVLSLILGFVALFLL
ncbi:hypothetical protein GCM10027416_00170 [Okibacterium endophyticum]